MSHEALLSRLPAPGPSPLAAYALPILRMEERMTPLTPEQVAKLMRRVRRLWTDGYLDTPERNKLERLGASHEAMREEWELFRGLAMRHIEGWVPQLHPDPAKCHWYLTNWTDGPEPMTSAEVEFYRKRREARQ